MTKAKQHGWFRSTPVSIESQIYDWGEYAKKKEPKLIVKSFSKSNAKFEIRMALIKQFKKLDKNK